MIIQTLYFNALNYGAKEFRKIILLFINNILIYILKEVEEEEVSEDFETNVSFHIQSIENYQNSGDKQTAELLVEVKEENRKVGVYRLLVEYFPEYHEIEFEDDDMLSCDVYFSEQEPQVVKVETIS